MTGPRRLTEFSSPKNRPLHRDLYAEVGSAALITIRTYRGTPFGVNRPLADSVVRLLHEMRTEYGCWVGAFCLMPDHLHLVSGPIEEGKNTLTFIERFKGKTTNESWKYGWSGRLWQSRQHDHLLRHAEALHDVYEYILCNPVRAGLVKDPYEWRWSGIIDMPE